MLFLSFCLLIASSKVYAAVPFHLQYTTGTATYCLGVSGNLAVLTPDLTQCVPMIQQNDGNIYSTTMGSLNYPQCNESTPCFFGSYSANVLLMSAWLNNVKQPSGVQISYGNGDTSKCVIPSGSAPLQLFMTVKSVNALNGVNNCGGYSMVTISPPSPPASTSVIPPNPNPVVPTATVSLSTTSSTDTPTSSSNRSQVTLFLLALIFLFLNIE